MSDIAIAAVLAGTILVASTNWAYKWTLLL
jgi:hypothetical protein